MSKEINPGYGWVPDNRAVEPEGRARQQAAQAPQTCAGCNEMAQKLDMAEQQEFKIRKEVSTARSLGDAVSLIKAVENIAGILGMLTEAEKCQRDFVKSGEKDAIAFALKWKEKK